MIGLDTNILVRFFTNDDPVQSKIANHIMIKERPPEEALFVNSIVICELVWVLSRFYKYDRSDIAKVLQFLLQTQEISFDYPNEILMAVQDYTAGGADLADNLIGMINQKQGCDITLTFDERAAALPYFEGSL